MFSLTFLPFSYLFRKDGAPTRDIEKDQLELEMIMKLGKELSGFWTLKCHLSTPSHFLVHLSPISGLPFIKRLETKFRL